MAEEIETFHVEHVSVEQEVHHRLEVVGVGPTNVGGDDHTMSMPCQSSMVGVLLGAFATAQTSSKSVREVVNNLPGMRTGQKAAPRISSEFISCRRSQTALPK